jgi:hypothetical protein
VIESRRGPPWLVLPRRIVQRQRLVLEVFVVRQRIVGQGLAAPAHRTQNFALFALYFGGVGAAPSLQVEVLADRIVQQTHGR